MPSPAVYRNVLLSFVSVALFVERLVSFTVERDSYSIIEHLPEDGDNFYMLAAATLP